jgi:futalosine hydrolase
VKKHYKLAVCFSTDLEGNGLPTAVNGSEIGLIRTGVGPVNAAIAVTRFLVENTVDALIACGVGGAYPRSGLEPGDVVCAESETYGDLGAESPAGFLDLHALGFPVIAGPEPLYNRMPLDLFPVARRMPFITCSTCTGSDAAALALVERTGGAVESMEGAGLVHAARIMGVKVGEVRGISNAVGKRDRARWKLNEAAAAARAAVIAWIESQPC